VDDPVVANELTRLRGRIAFARGSALRAHAMLLAAARGVAGHDPRAAAALLIEAARAAWNAYDPDRYAEATALLATLRLPDGDALGPVVATAIAIGDFVAGWPADPVIRMRKGIDAWIPLVKADQANRHDQEFVDASLALAGFTRVTCDDAAGLAVGTAAVAWCRARGLVAWLPWALANLSMTEAVAGRHAAAVVSATEGLRLAQDLDLPMAVCGCEASLAWVAAVRGEEEQCRQLADDAIRLAETHHLGAIAVFASWSLGLLELSLGRPERAFERLSDPVHGPMAVPSVRCLITPDLIEAAVRAGRAGDLADTVDWYEAWALATGQPVAEAAVHRCRAMLDDDEAQTHFAEALRLHERIGPGQRPFDRARTELLYGQWLRRVRRRADARPRLASAHETFQRLGATPWAERAATELRATGQTVPRRDAVATHLTHQEIQVVRLVAEGGSNQEVAAQMFLSPRTVAYHLYKAFPKLGITSRAELARLDLDELAAGSSVGGR
jgi:DNA-binding CsgD family transcriptional regulator